MPKIALIGAGSLVFAQWLTTSILSRPELQDSTLALMDIDTKRLELIGRMADRVVRERRLPARIQTTSDRRDALDGADYVVVTVQVGGSTAGRADVEIPNRYGVYQAVGDTLGPGGVFRALRTIPILLDICRDMAELCPRALLLDYANPLAMNCWAIAAATPIRAVGLCHSECSTARQLARYVGAPVEEIGYWAAGLNHQAWFLRFEWRGEDAYPRLRVAMEDPALYACDRVRFEVFRHFGYFVTESSAHLSEYVPYFRRTRELAARYAPPVERDFDGYLASQAEEHDSVRRQAVGELPLAAGRAPEDCSLIIHSIETNTPRRLSANVPNAGLIPNLPPGACVEVPCLIDNTGVHPCYVGDLPPQCAAINRTNVNVQELVVHAALTRDREKVYQAVALDPLTAAVLTLEEMRRMTDDLFAASSPWLPWH